MFTRSFIAALLSAVAYAQSTANPFKINGSLNTAAGKSLQLQWNPTTTGPVSLILRSGSSNNLAEGTTIASNIANSGSYTWNVPDSISRGSSYTVEIVSDSDTSETNYTPPFVIDSSNTAPISMSSVSLGAPSSSINLSTAAVTASPSSNSASATSSTSSASATGSSQSSTSSMATTTRASSSGAASATGSTSAAAQTGAAARATAAAGFLGVVALGALAL